MKFAHVVLASAVLTLPLAACRDKDDDGDENLVQTEAALIDDDAEATDADNAIEAVFEAPLSGSTSSDPDALPSATNDDGLAESAEASAKTFFTPAGCVQSTRSGNVVTSVFTDCTGPYGLAKLTGTIQSLYSVTSGKLQITHTTKDFQIHGATVSGTRRVDYEREGAAIKRTRVGEFEGTTAKGHPIHHTANFTTIYDPQTRCISRDGTATTTLETRSFVRGIEGYKRCGVGFAGCPQGGKIVLLRESGGEHVSLTIEFSGGTEYVVTRPNGRKITRHLLCREGD